MKAVRATNTAAAVATILLSAYTSPASSRAWPADTYTYIVQHANNADWHWSVLNGNIEGNTSIIIWQNPIPTLQDYFTLFYNADGSYQLRPRHVHNLDECVTNSGDYLQLTACNTASGPETFFWINCEYMTNNNGSLYGCTIQSHTTATLNTVNDGRVELGTNVVKLTVSGTNETWNLHVAPGIVPLPTINTTNATNTTNTTNSANSANTDNTATANTTNPMVLNDTSSTAWNYLKIATIVFGGVILLMAAVLGCLLHRERKRRIALMNQINEVPNYSPGGTLNNSVVEYEMPQKRMFKPAEVEQKPNSEEEILKHY